MSDPERKIRVVVVDDDPEVLALISVRVKDNPRIEIVGTGTSGREAIRMANALRPDVMVLDIMMPVLNGLEAAGRISRVFPSIGLIILTSEASPESIRTALRAGAKDYLDKSTELNKLPEVIVEADEKREQHAVDIGLASVWGFYSPKGAAGTTTLATATAYELAREGKRVLLLDMDTVHGDVAFGLNMKAGGTNLFTALEETSSMDAEFLSSVVRRWTDPEGRVGFDVIDSPQDVVSFTEHATINLVAAMDMFITDHDHVVIDLPSGHVFDHQNLAMLDFVERLFLLTGRDMPSLRSLSVFSKLLARSNVTLGRFGILFSPLRDQAGYDYTEWLATAKLKGKSLMEVPLDRELAGKALAAGLPVSAVDRRAPLARFVTGLVDVALSRTPSLAAAAGEESRSDGLWGTLRKMLGR